MSDRPTYAVINGPNLNLLGEREPHIYGSTTLADLEKSCAPVADELGCELTWFQSNHEGGIIDELQRIRGEVRGIVINAAAYTHTSIAIRDAVASLSVPFIEVHISNVHTREAFRHHSYLSEFASGVIVGCGTQGYELAVRRLVALTTNP